MYQELFVPVDHSQHSDWAINRAIEICGKNRAQITGNHVYAARLHDVRFRQLETGLPAQFQTPEELKHQRKVHDKLIEKGLQLISDSFLDQMEKRCAAADVPLRRQLLEGINYEEIVKEVNEGAGTLPSLIGFDPNIAASYDGSERMRSDVRMDEHGRIVADDETSDEKLAGTTGRDYDLVIMGAHGIGRQPLSQLGGVVARAVQGIEKDALIVRSDEALKDGRYMVCVDGSAYSYQAMRTALMLAREHHASLFVCSAFDVEYHHAVFGNIKDVLSERAAKVFKFEEQEELHNNIIDKGLLKLSQTHIKRAQVLAEEFPEVAVETQILIGKPFQVMMQWVEEIKPSLLILGRHGAHRIDGTNMGSQAENLLRLTPCNILLTSATGIKPEDIPWIEEDGEESMPWAPDAEVRIQRVPPFAQGIARRAVEEYTLEHGADLVTNRWLDEAIGKLLPTHMQLIMGIGNAEEIARAEIKAEQQMEKTLILGSETDAEVAGATVEVKCPVTPHDTTRERTVADPLVWTQEAFDRLRVVPLIARPLARNTVERFAREHGLWRITTSIMDENKQAMVDADEFDAETMTGMFRELRAKQIKAEAQGGDAMTPEMRRFIEEAKASGVSRCPIRDLEDKESACPVDLTTVSPEEAKAVMEKLINTS